MNLFRALGWAALSCVTGAGLSGCLTAPDYPKVPAIDFNRISVARYKPAGQLETDTLKFVVSYRDGDGNLGLSDADVTKSPYNATTGGHNNLGYKNNFYIQFYKQNPVNKQFTKFVNDKIGEYDGRFPRLDSTNTKPAPLKGDLKFAQPVTLDGGQFSPGDVFRFEISIMDRDLQESNTIMTSEVTLGQ